ncbi:hypothetical protein ACHAW6_011253 [Cyclotella cf. meneghiniana]
MMRRSARESRQPEEEGRKSKQPPPTSPASAPPPFPKTRCYRLNLEKPFDISSVASCSSPLYRNRDYSGPISEADLPPVQGPAEYYPPPHLCRQEELRRHSWGGSGHGSSAVDLMANLQVSESTDSQSNNETSVAISTARIFRGITVDRNGVILTQNARAMRSKKSGEKNKVGEKSRQAAKIDKAKDLIDEVLEAGVGMDSNEENDPTKIVSLYVMGEYDELNDLVRDGSKKLRESKSLPDEAILMYNRPRPVPPYIVSPSNHNSIAGFSSSSNRNSIKSPSNFQDPDAASPTNRKRVLGSRYKNVMRSAPPKLKSNPRDNRPSNRTRKSTDSSNIVPGNDKNSASSASSQQPQPQQQLPHSHHQQHNPHPHHHHYFREQCNFFPGPHSNWAEALGFSVNSLWNCGANNGHMSPTSHSVSPRSQSGGNAGTSGAGYDPNGYASGNAYHGSGYHYGYEEGRNPSSHGGAGGHYDDGYSRSRNSGVRDTVVM